VHRKEVAVGTGLTVTSALVGHYADIAGLGSVLTPSPHEWVDSHGVWVLMVGTAVVTVTVVRSRMQAESVPPGLAEEIHHDRREGDRCIYRALAHSFLNDYIRSHVRPWQPEYVAPLDRVHTLKDDARLRAAERRLMDFMDDPRKDFDHRPLRDALHGLSQAVDEFARGRSECRRVIDPWPAWLRRLFVLSATARAERRLSELRDFVLKQERELWCVARDYGIRPVIVDDHGQDSPGP
jgi:hypothetical protein